MFIAALFVIITILKEINYLSLGKLLKIFAYRDSVFNLNGDYSQEVKRRLRLRMAAVEELGKSLQGEIYH